MGHFNAKLFGRYVRAKRGEKSLRDIAPVIGVSPSTLSRIENGEALDTETFFKIIGWLEVSADLFAGVPTFQCGDKVQLLVSRQRVFAGDIGRVSDSDSDSQPELADRRYFVEFGQDQEWHYEGWFGCDELQLVEREDKP